MTEIKREKPDKDVFDDQVKNEAQVVVNRPRRPLFQRLVRVLLVLGSIYYLVLLHLRWSTTPKALYLKGHGHHWHKFGFWAERAFLSTPNAESAIQASRQYAGKPHLAGTEGDFETAELFLSLLQDSFNIAPPKRKPVFNAGTRESQDATRGIVERDTPSAWIDTYYPVMNTPLERTLQIVDDDGSAIWNADLKEHAPEGDDKDPDAVKYADATPTFHGLSTSGDVTGHLIDGNYCSKDDYDQLVANGAQLKGSIVLCRYGGIFRGLKVKGGQETGAVGVLIYSDPRDDGTVTVENGYAPYPDGPARNPTSVQRGSVQFLSIYPGDPTTPGYPSYENATRTEGANVPSIPSLPISWDNAQQLLQVLQAGNPLEGRQVRLSNNVDTRVIPIWNVIGVIPGYIKNEVVVTGNHRDAWVLGAVDPSSGTVSVHEVIRGFGHLMKKGWKPLRTIVIASWDAEEYGLIGSTEWGEDFADWIDKHVIAYFNLDSSVSGSRFATSGSPLLAHFIRDTAQDVPHPTDANRTLWDATNDDGVLIQPVSIGRDAAIRVAQTELEVAIAAADNLGVSPLGSGSDYTVFLQRIGVPSTNEGFSATLHDPVYHYHSVYDSEPWQEKFGDPGFPRHVAVAQHLGLQIMRMANAPLLPFNTTHYSLQLEGYLDTVESLRGTKALGLDLTELRSVIHRLQKASLRLDKEKHEAVVELKKLALRWWRHRHRHDHHHHRHHHHHHHHHDKFTGALKRLVHRVRVWFRHHHHGGHEECGCPGSKTNWHLRREHFTSDGIPAVPQELLYNMNLTSSFDQIFGEFYSMDFQHTSLAEAHVEDDDGDHGEVDGHKHKHKHKHHKKWRKALLHAIHRLHVVNNKLRSFEAGLISEDGIKDREWFKHLGVAPGKWLGYGATTFPGLTEAIVFDQDKKAAKHEVKRLIHLMEKMIKKLKA